MASLTSKIFGTLERRYPIIFDDCFSTVLMNLTQDQRSRINGILSSVDENSTDGINRLYIDLHHADNLRRELAVRALNVDLDSNCSSQDVEMLYDGLLERLQDDDPRVVLSVINSKHVGRLNVEIVVPSLIDIIVKKPTNGIWMDVKLYSISVLHTLLTNRSCSNFSLMPLLPLLFPTSDGELILAKSIVSHSWVDFCELFGDIVDGVKDGILCLEEVASLRPGHCSLLMSAIKKISVWEPTLKMKLVSHLMQENQFVCKTPHFPCVITPLLLSEIILSENDNDHKARMAVVVVEFITHKLQEDDSELKETNLNWLAITSSDVSSFLQTMGYNNNNCDVTASWIYPSFLNCLSRFITYLKGIDKESKSGFCLLHTLFMKLLLGVKTVPKHGHNPFQILMHLLIWEWFTDVNVWINFLLKVLKEESSGIRPMFQLQMRILHLLSLTLVSEAKIGQEINMTCLIQGLPWFLVLCQSPSENMRRAALDFLKIIDKLLSDSLPLKGVIQGLLHLRNEIISDANVFNNVLAKAITQEVEQNTDTATHVNLNVVLNWIFDEEIPMSIKCKLVQPLNIVSSVVILNKLISCLDSVTSSDEALSCHSYSFCCYIIRMFNKSTVAIFNELPAAAELFLKLIKNDKLPPNSNDPSLRIVMFQQIKKIFKALGNEAFQKQLLNNLINLVAGGMDTNSTRVCMDVLKKVLFDGDMICSVLQDVDDSSHFISSSLKEARSKSNANLSFDSVLENSNRDAPDKVSSRNRLVVILEAIQGKRTIKNCFSLIRLLFTLLKSCQDAQTPNEYEIQLIVSVLLNCTKVLHKTGENPNQSQFNVELIVQCIRSTSNARIHHYCFLFLASIAKWFPEYVLHNSMAIFTFMGENTFRLDDSHSFKVIMETIASIIPCILENGTSSGQPVVKRQKILITIIRTFVDALPDIPEHRQIPLFQCLLSALGGSKHLWLVVAIVLQSYIVWDTTRGSGHVVTRNVNKQTILDFSKSFSACFSSFEQLSLCTRLASHVFEVAGKLGMKGKESSKCRVFSIQQFSLKQNYHYLLLTVEFMSSVLSSDSFLRKIVDDDPEEGATSDNFEVLMKKTLQILHIFHSSSVDKNIVSPLDVNFYKLILHRTYELLDKCVASVKLDIFIEVIRSLLREKVLSIQSKAIEMLTTKLQKNDEKDVECFQNIVPDLITIIKAEEAYVDSKSISSFIMNKQLALLALKFIIRLLSDKYPDSFTEILNITISLSADQEANENLKATSLICLAEVCHALPTLVLPQLPRILKTVISVMEEIKDYSKQDLLLLSSVTVIHRVVEKLSSFLSVYLAPIIIKICHISCVFPEVKKSPLLNRLNSIKQNLTKDVPLRVLLPVLENCLSVCGEQHAQSFKTLMMLLRDTIRQSADNVVLWKDNLLKYFLTIFDYCSSSSYALDVRLEVEESVAESLLEFIVKLSEDMFRPIFIKLVDWVTREDAPHDRAVVFYFMVDKIADKLKSLFVQFAGHITLNAAQLLDKNNSSKTESLYFSLDEREKCVLLVYRILDSMHKCFLYCNDQFLHQERFEILVDPLVDQLENFAVGDENYEDLIVNHLMPCIAQFAVALSDDVHYKPLCYKILLKSRHSSPKVRYASLQIIQETATKLEQAFMTVLPEVVIFFAELMEDESAEVEQLCRSVIRNLEGVLGEPLQKYFDV